MCRVIGGPFFEGGMVARRKVVDSVVFDTVCVPIRTTTSWMGKCTGLPN